MNLGFSHLSFNSIYVNSNDALNLNRKVTDITISLYGEYGISNKFTLTAAIPIKMVSSGELNGNTTTFLDTLPDGSLTGLGNLVLSGKYLIIDGTIKLAGSLAIEGNTMSYDNTTGLRTGYDTWGLTPTLHIGSGNEYLYGFLDVGIGLQSNNYSHNFRLHTEIGVKPIEQLYIAAEFNIRESFENGNYFEPNNLHTGLYMNDQEYFAYGLKIGFTSISGFGGYISAMGGTSGNVIGRSPGYNIGVYYKLKPKSIDN